jgi:hypothetical protein
VALGQMGSQVLTWLVVRREAGHHFEVDCMHDRAYLVELDLWDCTILLS